MSSCHVCHHYCTYYMALHHLPPYPFYSFRHYSPIFLYRSSFHPCFRCWLHTTTIQWLLHTRQVPPFNPAVCTRSTYLLYHLPHRKPAKLHKSKKWRISSLPVLFYCLWQKNVERITWGFQFSCTLLVMLKTSGRQPTTKKYGFSHSNALHRVNSIPSSVKVLSPPFPIS
jgi:hypothetical protein